MMKTATWVKKIEMKPDAYQALYKVSPPLEYGRFLDEDGGIKTTEYVVVSATIVYGRLETFIFASDADGKIITWCEMPGSVTGILDHCKVFKNIGYKIVR